MRMLLETSLASGDSLDIAYAYKELGNVYKRAKPVYEEGLKYYAISLKIYTSLNDKEGIADVYNNMGTIYEFQGKLELAKEYYVNALELVRKYIKRKYLLLVCINDVGNIELLLGNLPKAEEYLLESLELAREIGLPREIAFSSENLSNYYQRIGDYPRALSYYRDFIQMRDSINSTNAQRAVAREQMNFEFEKKEAMAAAAHEKEVALKQKEKEQQQVLSLIAVAVLFIVLIFSIYIYRSLLTTRKQKVIIEIKEAETQQEKARSDELLLNILPEQIAEELKRKGESDAQLIEQATVLFTDFKGFTAMSELLSPKDLVKDLHQCFSAFDAICGKYGIEKIKTIGDAYMAAGGLPSPSATHAKDVVLAALEMIEVVRIGKMSKVEQGLPFFDVRIGIHTGPVVAGIVGLKKFQYDIWGDTVNTASRMESSGEAGKVNVSQTTYELLKDDPNFQFASRGMVAAKGKGEMNMWFVSYSG